MDSTYSQLWILLDVAIVVVLTTAVEIERNKMDKPSGWFLKGALAVK